MDVVESVAYAWFAVSHLGVVSLRCADALLLLEQQAELVMSRAAAGNKRFIRRTARTASSTTGLASNALFTIAVPATSRLRAATRSSFDALSQLNASE